MPVFRAIPPPRNQAAPPAPLGVAIERPAATRHMNLGDMSGEKLKRAAGAGHRPHVSVGVIGKVPGTGCCA